MVSKKQVSNAKLLLKKPEEKLSLSASVSKIKTFKTCKRKFKFNYVEKLPGKDWEHLKFGKFLHEVLENFHKKLIAKDDRAFHLIMNECFSAALINWKDLDQASKKEAHEILGKYLLQLNEQAKNNELANVIGVEKEFYINIDDKVLLTGFIDRIQMDPDGVLHVADYKTSKSSTYLEKDFFQLLTYGFAMCLEDPNLEKVRTSYVMLRDNFSFVTKEFTRKELMKIENEFLKYADKIMAETEYKPKASPLCSYCDFLDLCSEGQEFVEERKNRNNLTKFGVSDW